MDNEVTYKDIERYAELVRKYYPIVIQVSKEESEAIKKLSGFESCLQEEQ